MWDQILAILIYFWLINYLEKDKRILNFFTNCNMKLFNIIKNSKIVEYLYKLIKKIIDWYKNYNDTVDIRLLLTFYLFINLLILIYIFFFII